MFFSIDSDSQDIAAHSRANANKVARPVKSYSKVKLAKKSANHNMLESARSLAVKVVAQSRRKKIIINAIKRITLLFGLTKEA